MRIAPSSSARKSVAVRAGKSDEIYIGFPKNDYSPREGRKGRVIKDDPAKYPDRDELTGGWAGGEAGLWKFREEIKAEQTKTGKAALKPKPNGSPISGKAKIYVGFGKDELELKNTGAPGRIIYDDEEKYPSREDVGAFSGVVGGFAGGEVGVKAFTATGQVKLRKPGQPGGQQESPLSFGFLLLLAGLTGTALLTAAKNVF